MVRENVRFQEQNFTSDGTYFYSMLDGTQALQQKVDDGTIAFTYPLDTAVGGNIQELQWDGVHFWSLEDYASGFKIRKWALESFICVQKQLFTFTTGATHTYSTDSVGVEHYRLTVGVNNNGGGGYTLGLSDVHISDTSMLEPGDVITFVKKGTSAASRSGTIFVESVVVQEVLSATQVRLTAVMTANPHGDGKGFRGPDVDIDLIGGTNPPTPDEVFVTKYLWVSNANSPSLPGTPALYKIRASNGSNVIQFSGTEFGSVTALVFYAKYNQGVGLDNAYTTKYNTTVVDDTPAGGRQTYLLIAKNSILLFYNVSTNVIDRSMTMNNIKVDTISNWTIYDMEVLGVEPNIVLYRLQNGTTYKNTSLVLTDESWASNYNYEKQLLRRIVNSIAVGAEPSIIPADGNSTSAISATLRDQYNDLIPSGKNVNWSDDSGGSGGGTGQGLFNTQSATDSFGVARNTYKSGTTEKDVKITASVTNGLV
jgi:hypothetical protein